MSEELLPCPFCGNPIIHEQEATEYAFCGECYGNAPTSEWNKRTSPNVSELRADYFVSLLTRLLATRQDRTVGYEPPEVQELWRKVEKAIEGKEGAK